MSLSSGKRKKVMCIEYLCWIRGPVKKICALYLHEAVDYATLCFFDNFISVIQFQVNFSMTNVAAIIGFVALFINSPKPNVPRETVLVNMTKMSSNYSTIRQMFIRWMVLFHWPSGAYLKSPDRPVDDAQKRGIWFLKFDYVGIFAHVQLSAVVGRSTSGHSYSQVACSNPLNASQLTHVFALCWLLRHSCKWCRFLFRY